MYFVCFILCILWIPCQALNSRLEEAAEKIQSFNEEEDAFEWDRSQYPLRSKLVNTLGPYLKLYQTISDFENKHK